MSRLVRRSLFVLGLLAVFAGGVGSSGPVVALGAILILVSLPTERRTRTPAAPAVVEAAGRSWTQRPDGTWLRWNAGERVWKDLGPPPPEVMQRASVRESSDGNGARTLASVVAAALVAATLCAFFDPRAQIPVISPIVCSVKGQTWHAGSTIAPAGCYQRDL